MNRELLFDFFWIFSSMEYALKRLGFLKSNKGAAFADWEMFAKEIDLMNVGASNVETAIDVLLKRPPKRQVVLDGKLAWKPRASRGSASGTWIVLCAVKDVRNNLFHGGKFPSGPIEEIERDIELISAAKIVLEACIEAYPGIREWLGSDALEKFGRAIARADR